MLEEMFKEDPYNIPDTWILDDEEATDPESSQPTEAVPVRGYDHDFWEPLLAETLGGSHAAEVIAGIHVPKTAPDTYRCTTGNAFDHTVRFSGEDDTDWKKYLDFLGVHQTERTLGRKRPAYTRNHRDDPATPHPNVQHETVYTWMLGGSSATPQSRLRPRSAYTPTGEPTPQSRGRPSSAYTTTGEPTPFTPQPMHGSARPTALTTPTPPPPRDPTTRRDQ